MMAGKGVRHLNVVATSVLLLTSCTGSTSVAERDTRAWARPSHWRLSAALPLPLW